MLIHLLGKIPSPLPGDTWNPKSKKRSSNPQTLCSRRVPEGWAGGCSLDAATRAPQRPAPSGLSLLEAVPPPTPVPSALSERAQLVCAGEACV